MSKFLIINDLHWQGTAPVGRKDDYPAAIEAKLREAFDIAQQENARAILVSGDFTHSPGISIPTFLRLYRLLKDAPCEILAIHGSPDHDGAAESIGRTWYQVLVDAGAIRDLETLPWPWQEGSVVFTGKGANPDTDHGINDYLPPADWATEGQAKIQIHLAHGMLLERNPGEKCPFKFTTLEQVAADPAAPDVLICGHYHPGWGIKRVGKALFINPGAIARTQATIVEMERTVQVALLEIDGGSISARLIPLQSAKPGSEVISWEHLEREALRDAKRAEFNALLNGVGELRALELTEIVDAIADQHKVAKEVREESHKRLADAREKGAKAA